MKAGWITGAVLLLASPLSAQQQPVAGDRVRVRAVEVEGWWYGAYEGVTDGRIRIRPEGQDVIELPLGNVAQLEVSVGRKKRHPFAGMAVGLGSGALLGALVCSAACQEGFFTEEQSIGMAATAGAVAGTLIGLIVGTAVVTEAWKPVELPTAPAMAVPGAGRFSVGVSIPLPR